MRVPTYERREREIALPGSRFTGNATADSFGAGEARAIGRLGQSAQNVADQILVEQQKLNRAEARDAVTQAQRESDEYLNGVYQRQGKDASGVFDESKNAFDEIKKRYQQDLKSEYAKDLFNSTFDNYVTTNSRRVLKHQSDQIQAYENQSLDAQNKQLEDNSVVNRYDIAQIKENEQDIIANTRVRFKGFDGPAMDKAIADRIHNMYTQILDARTNEAVTYEDMQENIKFLKDNLDKFNPKIRAELKKGLENKANTVWVNEKAVELANSGLPIEKQLEQVDKIKNKDPKYIQALRSDVQERYNFKSKVQEGKLKQQYENEVDSLFQDPVNYKIPLELSAEQQSKLYKLRKTLKNDILAESGVGEKTKTDPYYYDELANMTPDQLSKSDLDFTKLSPSDRKKFIDARADARKGDIKSLTSIRSNTQMVKGALATIGKDDDVEAQDLLSRRFQEDLSIFETNKGSKATPEEKQKVLDRLIIEGEVKGNFFRDKDKFLFEVEEGEEFFIEDVPKDERLKILAALKKYKMELSDENVIKLYTRKRLNE